MREKRTIVLSPAFDGGYTLIGVSDIRDEIFDGIPWSTADVYRLTVQRVRQIGYRLIDVPGWYDVDDAKSLDILRDEMLGRPTPFANGAAAPFTRDFLMKHLVRNTEPAA